MLDTLFNSWSNIGSTFSISWPGWRFSTFGCKQVKRRNGVDSGGSYNFYAYTIFTYYMYNIFYYIYITMYIYKYIYIWDPNILRFGCGNVEKTSNLTGGCLQGFFQTDAVTVRPTTTALLLLVLVVPVLPPSSLALPGFGGALVGVRIIAIIRTLGTWGNTIRISATFPVNGTKSVTVLKAFVIHVHGQPPDTVLSYFLLICTFYFLLNPILLQIALVFVPPARGRLTWTNTIGWMDAGKAQQNLQANRVLTNFRSGCFLCILMQNFLAAFTRFLNWNGIKAEADYVKHFLALKKQMVKQASIVFNWAAHRTSEWFSCLFRYSTLLELSWFPSWSLWCCARLVEQIFP